MQLRVEARNITQVQHAKRRMVKQKAATLQCPTAICLGLGLSFELSPVDGGIAMGMGVFQVGAGLILYTLGSRSLPAAELALLSLAEVLLGPLWVWLFLGETASVNTLIGGAVLLAAIAGNALSGKRRKPPPITAP